MCQKVRAALEQLVGDGERIGLAILEVGESRVEPAIRSIVAPQTTPHLTLYNFYDPRPQPCSAALA